MIDAFITVGAAVGLGLIALVALEPIITDVFLRPRRRRR